MLEPKPQDAKRIREIVDNMTLFDDDLMSMVFDNNYVLFGIIRQC